EEVPQALVEELEAPVERGPKRLVAGIRVLRPSHEELESVLELLQHLRRCKYVGARCRKLEGERNPFQLLAYGGERLRVAIGNLEIGPNGLGTVDEHLDTRKLVQTVRRAGHRGNGKRPNRDLPLAAQPNRLARCG